MVASGKEKKCKFLFIIKILENSNWIYVLIEKESIDYFALNNKSKKLLTVNKNGDGIPNNIDDFAPFNPQFVDVDGNLVEFSLTASDNIRNWQLIL